MRTILRVFWVLSVSLTAAWLCSFVDRDLAEDLGQRILEWSEAEREKQRLAW
jgi:hypothetical protein